MRFSIAHELGHFYLHKDILNTVSFDSEDEWVKFVSELNNSDRLEIQANEFAGRLVVPRERLVELIKQERIKATEFAVNAGELESVLAMMLSRKFNTSQEVITIRFQRENLLQLIFEK